MFSYDFSFNVWLALIMSLDAPCETFDSKNTELRGANIPSSNHEPDASIGRIGRIGPEHEKNHHFSSKIYHHYHPQISPSDFHIFFTGFSLNHLRASPQQLQLPLPVPGCHVWAAGPMRCLWKLDDEFCNVGCSDDFWCVSQKKWMWMFWWFLMCFSEKMDVGRCWMSGYIGFFICWNVWVILTASCRTWWRSVSEPWPCQSLFQPQKPWRQTMQMPNFVGCWCLIYIYLWVYTIVCEFVLLYLMLLLVFVHGSVFSADFISFVW